MKTLRFFQGKTGLSLLQLVVVVILHKLGMLTQDQAQPAIYLAMCGLGIGLIHKGMK